MQAIHALIVNSIQIFEYVLPVFVLHVQIYLSQARQVDDILLMDDILEIFQSHCLMIFMLLFGEQYCADYPIKNFAIFSFLSQTSCLYFVADLILEIINQMVLLVQFIQVNQFLFQVLHLPWVKLVIIVYFQFALVLFNLLSLFSDLVNHLLLFHFAKFLNQDSLIQRIQHLD